MDFKFPLWFPGAEGSVKVDRAPVMIGSDLSRNVPIFTTEEAGKAFIEINGGASNFLRRVQTPMEFFGLLVLLEKKGFANVTIDPSPSVSGTNQSRITAVPIRALREQLEGAFL